MLVSMDQTGSGVLPFSDEALELIRLDLAVWYAMHPGADPYIGTNL